MALRKPVEVCADNAGGQRQSDDAGVEAECAHSVPERSGRELLAGQRGGSGAVVSTGQVCTAYCLDDSTGSYKMQL